MIKKIPYGRHHITDEDLKAVVETLKSDFITQGPQALIFEKNFAKYIGSKYAVSLANGTAALHLCSMVLGVNENTKVLTTPITFSASANCVRYCGGSIDFVDIDPNTALIDLKALRKKLKSVPKGTYSGIIPVDFAGYPVNLEKVREIADEYGLWIIEDACHAPGASYKASNQKIISSGSCKYADLAIFSLHPVKHIAAGEGGMITTNSKALYEKLIMLRSHGITRNPKRLKENHGNWYYEMQYLGYNYRLTDFQAALGNSQLQRAEKKCGNS